jgi:hypothetical protein
MSNEENTEQTVDSQAPASAAEPSAAEKVAGITATLLALKEKNPKVFFGAIGGVVVLLILLMSGGDGSKKPPLKGAVLKDITLGQRYVLKSANAYDPSATVRLVSAPGAIAAYDDTEEADRNGVCQHMAQGTTVSALEFADAYGKKNSYVKVKIEDGDCKGNEGWALAIDVQ